MARTRTEIKTSRGEWIFNSLSLDGSVTPANEFPLGFTDEGAELDMGQRSFLDTNEESGLGPGVAFYAGRDIRIRFILKQWSDKNLEVAFPNQFNTTDNRIEIPGDLSPGDDLTTEAKTLLFRPDDLAKDPYILAPKALLVSVAPIQIRTLEARLLGLEFQLLPDETLVGGGLEKYRTLGIALSGDISHP